MWISLPIQPASNEWLILAAIEMLAMVGWPSFVAR